MVTPVNFSTVLIGVLRPSVCEPPWLFMPIEYAELILCLP